MAHYARQVELDFGAIPVTQATFTIVDGAVTPDAVISGAALPAGLSVRAGVIWTEE